jgi:hypothetical protein
MIFSTQNEPPSGKVGLQPRMVIDKDGFVGIGTVIPKDALDVQGHIRAAGNLRLEPKEPGSSAAITLVATSESQAKTTYAMIKAEAHNTWPGSAIHFIVNNEDGAEVPGIVLKSNGDVSIPGKITTILNGEETDLKDSILALQKSLEGVAQILYDEINLAHNNPLSFIAKLQMRERLKAEFPNIDTSK